MSNDLITTDADAAGRTRHSPLHRLGEFLTRHAKAVLLIAAVVLAGAAVLGTTAFAKLQGGGFDDPSSDSSKAAAVAAQHFPSGPNLVLLVVANDGRIDTVAARAAGAAVTEQLRGEPDTTVDASWFTTPAPSLLAADGRSALILAHVGGTEGDVQAKGTAITKDIDGVHGPVTVKAGGNLGINSDINDHVASSLAIAEAIAVPITLILLLLVFGSVVAALLPLLIGTFAIFGTFAELSILGSITDVSVFSINLTTALGLGLGIDYGLLIVARFREQLRAGDDVGEAVARTVATAGRTILFSAAAVMVALATLTTFPLYFLSSFGYAGIGVVVIAAAAALLLMPAVLALLGHRVEKGRLRFAGLARGTESPLWGRIARAVFRRPIRTAAPVLVLLLLLAAPLLRISFALPDVTVLRTDAVSRQVADALDAQFPSQSNATLWADSSTPVDPAAAAAQARAYLAVPQVSAVDYAGATLTRTGSGAADPSTVYAADGFQRLQIHTTLPGGSTAARQLVGEVRGVTQAPFLIGGTDAQLSDTLAGISRSLPLVFVIIVLATFVLLFLFTGSIVQPLRALVVNSLSLAAALGIVTWVFQDGHLIGLFGATSRPMDASMTVLLLCIVFGLSMDYEVFLASRITELHAAGADLRTAVTSGLARTGRIVSSAAVLLAVSFFAFTTSSVSMLQLFGLGAGLAVLIDATLIRGVLVPAAMRLLGRANFYAPRPLAALHRRIGMTED